METADVVIIGGGVTGSIDPSIGYDPVKLQDPYGGITTGYSLWTAEQLVRCYPFLERSKLQGAGQGLSPPPPIGNRCLGSYLKYLAYILPPASAGKGSKLARLWVT